MIDEIIVVNGNVDRLEFINAIGIVLDVNESGHVTIYNKDKIVKEYFGPTVLVKFPSLDCIKSYRNVDTRSPLNWYVPEEYVSLSVPQTKIE